ncbi:DsbA family protein [Streptomyces sp. 6N223]|uniref:DsbA family protein n=1 Tax=Streptomyces sp. 6N223 TaxID=3457412 RepID=UPI003FD26C19
MPAARPKPKQLAKSTKSTKNTKSKRQPPRAGTYGARAARPYAAALLAALLIGSLLLVMLSALAGGDGGGSDDSAGDGGEEEIKPLPSDNPALALARRDADDPLALGDVDAPIVMIEYADFQDAFVGIHARDTHDRLVREYVDAGILRIEFRNYPINGPESDAAARAAWAAGRQDRFWEFHEAALGEQFNLGSGRFEEDGLRALAAEAGIPDIGRFLRDTESDEAGEAVGRDAQEAYDMGVSTVPSFLIDGHPLSGAQSLGAFREIIDPLHEAERE